MGGLDWLFVQRKIYDYSDAELMLAIEYHGQRKQLLEKEQERRKLEKAHRYAGVKVQNIALSPVTQSTTTVHVSKKTTSTKSTKAAAQATALIASLLANGTSLDDLLGKVKKP
jgi:predicted lipid carrier protein YhbT